MYSENTHEIAIHLPSEGIGAIGVIRISGKNLFLCSLGYLNPLKQKK